MQEQEASKRLDEDVERHRRLKVDSDRLTGACIAMARIMAFVWMEAEASEVWGRFDWARGYTLKRALASGLFRLEFAR